MEYPVKKSDYRSLEIKCAFLMACYYMSLYLVMMFSTYLVSFGYDEVYISTCSTVSAVVTLLLKPLWARLADAGRCRLEALVMVCLMEVGFVVFFTFRTEKITAILYSVLVTVSSIILMDLIDSWVVKLSKETGNIDYGKTRSFGSISFAVTGLLFGFATTRFGLSIAPYVMSVILLAIGIVSQTVPDPILEERTKRSFKESLSLLRDRRFLFFTIAYSLANTAFNFTDAYIPVLILNRGGNTTHIGVNDFVMSFIEFLMLKQFTRIADRFGTDKVLTLGMFGFFIKAGLAALAPTPALTVAACLSQCVSFCMFVPGRMRFLQEEIDKDNVSTAMSIVGIAGSLANIGISNTLSQKLIPSVGLPGTMMTFAFIALGASFIYYLGNGRKKDKQSGT